MRVHIIVVIVLFLFLSSLQYKTQQYLSEEVESNLILQNTIDKQNEMIDQLTTFISNK